MRQRPIVLMDCDEVIADFAGHYVRLASVAVGETLDPNKIVDWDIAKCLNLQYWAKNEVEYYLGQSEAALRIPELPGAVAAVKEIAKVADVYFVTSPYKKSRTWPADRTEWLIQKFGEDQGNKVIHTEHKELILGDVFVDDKIENVTAWAEVQSGIPVLWDRIHNRKHEVAPPIVRATDWEFVIRLVKGIT